MTPFGIFDGTGTIIIQSSKNEVNPIENDVLDINLIPEQKTECSKALESALKVLNVPKGYVLRNIQGEKQNHDDVWLFRYDLK